MTMDRPAGHDPGGAPALLQMRGITKSFPGVRALSDVSFTLEKGEVHVVVGENGAGKSTLIKILSGAYKADDGEVLIDGRKVLMDNPQKALKQGVSVIYQELNLNPYMPIYENIYLGRERTNVFGMLRRSLSIREAHQLLEKVGIDISPRVLVKNLGIAQKQMVEIAKAMSLNARIFVFDEPTSTLSQAETTRLFALIRDLRASGCGIIYISHRLEEIFQIGDRCTILRDGVCIGTRAIAAVSVRELISMMVGRDLGQATRRVESFSKDHVVLRVEGLCLTDVLSDISFELREGEILGLAGLVGSGRTELAKCIIGDLKKTAGRIVLDGAPVSLTSVKRALARGIAYVSEDRKKEGLFLKHQVSTNMTIASLRRISRYGLLSRRAERELCAATQRKLQIRSAGLNTQVRNLSGGNQQKVVIAKWLLTQARIFIFDEPTRGIDVGAKDEIHGIMLELLRHGASIIMISSDMPELLALADRILVMRMGKTQAVLENRGISQEDILSLAVGAHSFAGR